MKDIRVTPGRVIVTVLLLGFTVLVFIPFVMAVLMSVKDTIEIITQPLALPRRFRWENYVDIMVMPHIRFYRFIINSAVVSGGAIVLTLVLSSLAGYGFARRRYGFRYREAFFVLIMLSLMLPIQAMYIPQYQLMAQYGLTNTRIGLILLYAAYQLGIATLLTRSYFAQLPEELEESARIDGAKDAVIFLRIMLPLARPVLLTVTLLCFVWFWNELLLALTMVTRISMRTVPLAMMYFAGETGADFGMAAAALVVSLLPVLVLYLFFADWFARGLTAGALKG